MIGAITSPLDCCDLALVTFILVYDAVYQAPLLPLFWKDLPGYIDLLLKELEIYVPIPVFPLLRLPRSWVRLRLVIPVVASYLYILR